MPHLNSFSNSGWIKANEWTTIGRRKKLKRVTIRSWSLAYSQTHKHIHSYIHVTYIYIYKSSHQKPKAIANDAQWSTILDHVNYDFMLERLNAFHCIVELMHTKAESYTIVKRSWERRTKQFWSFVLISNALR